MTKEIFLERLEKENIAEDLALQLQQEKLPLLLWGCGDVANAVYDYLKKKNVILDGVFLDGITEPVFFHGIPVMSREEVKKRYEKVNVILGHCHYEKGEQLKVELQQVHQVFYAFSIHYEQYQKVAYADIEKEAERFVTLSRHLSDEVSVKNLMAYLNTKLTGDVTYILDIFQKPMSFYHNDVFRMSKEEVFLDIGAYNGDTIRLFLEETGGSYKKIIALEPDDKSFLELNEYLAIERMKNVVTTKIGAWNRRENLLFKTGNEQISSVATGSHILENSEMITIYADRLDEIFKEEEITFVKINYYEGVLEAIEGCEGILRRQLPKMAVDVGFDIFNVLKLTEYLTSLKLGYRMFLRFNKAMSSTFTLYAVAEK